MEIETRLGGTNFKQCRDLAGEHRGKPPVCVQPLSRARVYARSHSGEGAPHAWSSPRGDRPASRHPTHPLNLRHPRERTALTGAYRTRALPSPQPGIGYPNNVSSIAIGVPVNRAVSLAPRRNRQFIGVAQRLTVWPGAGPGGMVSPTTGGGPVARRGGPQSRP